MHTASPLRLIGRRRALWTLLALPVVAGCLATTAVGTPPRLPDGIYPALGEPSPDPQRSPPAGQRSLRYDPKLADSASLDPVTYVTVDAVDYVPLILSRAPQSQRQEDGRLLVAVSLAESQVEPLARFTRAHLNQRIALVLDGEVMSTHKIRTVIEGGQLQITRCDDHACERILSKLIRRGPGQ